MFIAEIVEVLDAVRNAYNSGGFDFIKWHTIPLFVIEDSSNEIVSDPVIFERVFETIVNCSKYLDLPTVDYHLKHIYAESDAIVVTSIAWEFSNTHTKVELVLEIGHVMQKKDGVWKILAILQPTWREPLRKRQDIKRMDKGGDRL